MSMFTIRTSVRCNNPATLEEFDSGTCFDRAAFNYKFSIFISTGKFLANNKRWKIIKNIHSKSLSKDMIVLAKYCSSNCGLELLQILGVTDCIEKYGEEYNSGKISFNSVKEALIKYNAKTLEELKDKQNLHVINNGITDSYGHDSRLVIKDLVSDESGPYFYIFENKWCRGSGAEALSFILVEEDPFTQEELDKIKEDNVEKMVKEHLNNSIDAHFLNVV